MATLFGEVRPQPALTRRNVDEAAPKGDLVQPVVVLRVPTSGVSAVGHFITL